MQDVAYLKTRQGLWVFKALTEKARVEMRKLLDVPPLEGDVFMHAADKDFTFVLTALNRSGLNTDPDSKPRVDVKTYTDF
jgi:hypothetical protein